MTNLRRSCLKINRNLIKNWKWICKEGKRQRFWNWRKEFGQWIWLDAIDRLIISIITIIGNRWKFRLTSECLK